MNLRAFLYLYPDPAHAIRILLEEDLPRRLAPLLVGHDVDTVTRCGWSGVKNGKLLVLAATKFDVFLTWTETLSTSKTWQLYLLPLLCWRQ